MNLFVDTREVSGSAPDGPRKVSLFGTERLALDVHVLGAGQAHRVHAHAAEDKCYVVLSGRARIVCGDEERVCDAGQAVLCPAGVPHGAANDGREDLRLLVLMAPPPRRPAAPALDPACRIGHRLGAGGGSWHGRSASS